MRGFRVLFAKEMAEQWRTMRLPSGLAVFAFIGIASPLFARYAPDIVTALGGAQFKSLIPSPTIADALGQFVKNLGQLGAALAIILAMSSVSAEYDRGTLAFVLSKPVTRVTFLAAKLLALGTSIAAGAALAAGLTYLYTAILFSTPDPRFVVIAALGLVELLVFTALTFAASTLTRSTIAAAGVGFVFLVVLGGLSLLPHAGDYTPSGMVARGLSVMTSWDYGSLIGPVAVQVAIVAVAFALAAIALRRQEI